MKKKKLVFISGGALALGAAAFLVAGGAGVPEKPPPDYSALRGTDAYYSAEPGTKDLPDFVGNLKGSQGRVFVKVGLSVVYRLGPELADAGPRFADRSALIMDRLHMVFGGKTYEDVEGAEKKLQIKDEIRRQLQDVLFPDKKGRVEDILYRAFYIQ